MQTRKKSSGRTASREHTSPKVTRAQKKAHENVKVLETKVSDMITSSSRKQRVGGAHKKNEDPVIASTLSTNYDLLLNETSETCLGHDALSDDCKENKGCMEGTNNCVLGTIFSPGFHIPKHAGGESANGVDFVKFFQNGDHTFHQEMEMKYSPDDAHRGYVGQETSESTVRDENYFVEATNISSEVSAIYLAMKNNKLEYCAEEEANNPWTKKW